MTGKTQIARSGASEAPEHLRVGKRSAVGPKSGPSVHQSDPGLRRPTPPPTAGRKPEACPPIHSHGFWVGVAPKLREAGLPYQPKTGRGTEQSSVEELQREALDTYKTTDSPKPTTLNARTADSLSDDDIQQFIAFFKTLDRWDREQHGN
jgi:hypothetical protein